MIPRDGASIQVELCSTPFGITEVGIPVEARVSLQSQSAQRLSASQRWAFDDPKRFKQSVPVLNAFRHHRGGHPARQHWRAGVELCSTPFGITEVGIRPCRGIR